MSPVIIPPGKVRHWLTPIFWIAICSSAKESLCPTLPKALVSTVCSRSPTLRTAQGKVWWMSLFAVMDWLCTEWLSSSSPSQTGDPCTLVDVCCVGSWSWWSAVVDVLYTVWSVHLHPHWLGLVVVLLTRPFPVCGNGFLRKGLVVVFLLVLV